MLLTVDIGNTNITLGVFEGKKLHVTFRMTRFRHVPQTNMAW